MWVVLHIESCVCNCALLQASIICTACTAHIAQLVVGLPRDEFFLSLILGPQLQPPPWNNGFRPRLVCIVAYLCTCTLTLTLTRTPSLTRTLTLTLYPVPDLSFGFPAAL